MKCLLCHKQEAIECKKICDTCLLEIELAFAYHINGKEVTKETYEKEINEEFKNG